MRRRDDDSTHRPSGTPSGRSDLEPPNAFDREFLDGFSKREPAPATPEGDSAGPWRVTRLHGDGDPLWACYGAGERPPRFSFREPDLAFLTATGLTLVDRPSRFKFLRDAEGTLHLMHDGWSVGTAHQESEQLPMVLTALANLRVQPQALAQLLLAVPDEVLRRCGVILAQMAREGSDEGSRSLTADWCFGGFDRHPGEGSNAAPPPIHRGNRTRLAILGMEPLELNMALAAIQESPPLITDDHGVVRVGGTRVTLDVVVHAYDAGASPEEIVQSFPTLKLPDVYATIAYLLRHRGEVDAYLAEQAAEAEAIRRTIEERYPTAELRQRLRARQTAT
jgi:uncharacterized protein (DUF433 family)